MAAAIGLLVLLVGVLLYYSLLNTDGLFTYALDDPYIHMAIAKNFSQYGVWGVTKHEFASATSSVGWTLLLSLLYALFGVHDLTPFLANLAIAFALIMILPHFLKPFALSKSNLFVMLAACILFTPIHVLIFNGMEHLLHAVITLLFLFFAAESISCRESRWFKGANLGLLLLSPFVILMRFEGVFAVSVVGLLLLMRRRMSFALMVGMLSVLPIAVYQALAASAGWYWLPNPILIRTGIAAASASTFDGAPTSFLTRILDTLMGLPSSAHHNVQESPVLLVALIVAVPLYLWMVARQNSVSHTTRILLLLFAGVTALHLLFGKVGHFYRYEAYLVLVAVTTIGAALNTTTFENLLNVWKRWGRWRRMAVWVLLVGLSYFPLQRTFDTLSLLPQAAKNIYEQHYQMAMFVKSFYNGGAIAVNDIGAINYYADIYCLDLVGLASLDVLKSKLANSYTSDRIDELAGAKGVQIAIVYDHWFSRGRSGPVLPPWQRVGQWTIRDNIVASGETISFYSVRPAEERRLIRNLQEFSVRLPKGVIQSGLYVPTADAEP